MKEIPTKNGDRMAFVTLEDMDGTAELTVFPAPFKAAAALLRSREPILVRGRVDDTEKGRVVLAEEVRPLEQAVAGAPSGAGGAAPQACRIRVGGDAEPGAVVGGIERACQTHPGAVPVFLHVRLPDHEVVIRATRLAVDASADLVAEVEALLGPGTIILEYGRRA